MLLIPAAVRARTMMTSGLLRHRDRDESSEYESSEAVTSSRQVLAHRSWVTVGTGCRREPLGPVAVSRDGHRFRLLTYNILSDEAIGDGEYLYCASELRYMSSRHDRIINEIRAMQPNCVCFQVFLYTSPCLPVCLSVCLSLHKS